jgi:hypothetical protein
MSQKTPEVKREEDELKLLEWAEKRGIENLSDHLQAVDNLKRESERTLTVLYAAFGATLAYVIKNLDKSKFSASVVGAIAMLSWLFFLSGWLILFCLKVKPAPSARNEPQNLIYKIQPVADAITEEIENMKSRIARATERTGSLSWHLNRVRLAALLSPAIFALGFFAPHLYYH